MLASRLLSFVLLITMMVFASINFALAGSVAIEPLIFDTNPAPNVKPVKLEAKLYVPQSNAPVSAMVIISSSGGVLDQVEGYYARELVKRGIAALVVDSFRPRGVGSVVAHQNLVTSWQMENDAFAALAMLRNDKRIDASKIGIMGASKGGLVAQNAAFTIRQQTRRTGTLAFAVHVPIVPDCNAQFRTAETTGKPIFYMLGELDDYTTSKPCLEYAERIKSAGNANVAVKAYKGAHHNWEFVGPLIHMAKAENYSKCSAMIEDNGDRTMLPSNQRVGGWQLAQWMKENCIFHGAHYGGGTEKLKRQATDDLITFLKQNGF
jgi:dienelactone hydrolase